MKQKELKAKMPGVAAFIEQMVEVFGQDAVHGAIRSGLAGESTFRAFENGHQIGAVEARQKTVVAWDRRGVSYSYEIPYGMPIGDERRRAVAALAAANGRVPPVAGAVSAGVCTARKGRA